MSQGRLDLDKILFHLMFIYLVVDSINGIILRSDYNLLLSVSQFYKIILLSFMFLRLMFLSKKYYIVMYLFFLYYVTVISINFYVHNSINQLFNSIIWFSKLAMIPLTFFYFKKILSLNKRKYKKKVIRVFTFNYLVFIVNILLGMMGYGYEQYSSEGIGTRGFFFAGNEVSGLFIIFTGLLIFLIWDNGNKLLYVICSVFTIAISIEIATKVSIIGAVISIFMIPIVCERNKLFKLTKLKLKFLVIGSFGFIIISRYIYFFIKSIGLLNRWEYLYMNYNGSLLTTILSNRNTFVERKMYIFINEYSFLQKIFGTGTSTTVEMDFFNNLFNYGIIGASLVLFLWLYFLFNSFKKLKFKEYYYAPAIFTINFLLIPVSFFAGHILSSGMAGTFIGMSNALVYYKKDIIREGD
ncbi:hypothetical protein JCM16358_12830 [Halanaerocella petrolearia]